MEILMEPTNTIKYDPVQPVTITQAEYPALHRLAARTYELAQCGTMDLQSEIERQDGVAIPTELLDIAISISIGENQD